MGLLVSLAEEMNRAGLNMETMPQLIEGMQAKLRDRAPNFPPEIPGLIQHLEEAGREGDLLEMNRMRLEIEKILDSAPASNKASGQFSVGRNLGLESPQH